ncbi:hypothetical protein FHQ18_02995 [Deferribacter autotrophicus]|uniref:Cytochrome c n=1 Tax=Deferribacter autotrophicus TaxID=500465 RepID=A0A5A8F6P8_9BACT|nr:hypothetical protein [Deferribacter autotrophicus]KAA0258929.1 hypothetical protein FHQ18_02995 [Deferribacter autotrophicus]
MKKRFFILFLISTLIFTAVINAYAVNQRAGKRKFKKYCHKKCHSGKNKDIPYITPSSFTIDQWKLYFNNNMKKLKDVHKNGELDSIKLKPKHYKNIEAFLTNHGLGSFEPESCNQ